MYNFLEDVERNQATDKDRPFSEANEGECGCIYIQGCHNIAVNEKFGLCDYHMMPEDGRADPYRDSAPYLGYDI